MATEVISTIGTAARDFSTHQAWETAKQADLVAADEQQTGNTFNDSDFANRCTVSGSTVDATRFLKITVETADRHTGKEGTGAINKGDASNSHTFELIDSFTVLEWIEVINNRGTSQANCTRCATGSDMTIQHCILHKAQGGGVGFGEDGCRCGADSVNFLNNFIYDCNDNGINLEGADNCKIINNTILKCANGIAETSPTTGTKIHNTISLENTVEDMDSTITESGDSSNNLTSDATALGTGPLINQTSADVIVDINVATADLHLKAGSPALDAGEGRLTDSDVPALDIDQEARAAGAAVADIGGDEVAAVAATGRRGRSKITTILT